jgi:hypothetical protein
MNGKAMSAVYTTDPFGQPGTYLGYVEPTGAVFRGGRTGTFGQYIGTGTRYGSVYREINVRDEDYFGYVNDDGEIFKGGKYGHGGKYVGYVSGNGAIFRGGGGLSGGIQVARVDLEGDLTLIAAAMLLLNSYLLN